ncbi:RNA polymerase [Tothia fuscella]|uniref:DNA-directed RNA polymerases I, II, and III subunit RPABC3 n=1 Tax=Tothia fuscella TaxID=1048955 RepID=A0A9P4TUY7_9PEZI|nr:RNA polymerase [Tothia fuscella]
MADSQLYLDTFTIRPPPPGKDGLEPPCIIANKYDRVLRLKATSSDNSTLLSLDINTDMFQVSKGDTIEVLLASTLNLDGSKDAPEKGWRETGEQTLADMWDYVCYGRVYRFEEGAVGGDSINVYASFGGLLMELKGPYKKLTSLRINHVYLLVKK